MGKSYEFCIRYLMKEIDPSEEIELEREMMADENLLIEVESLRKTYQKLQKLPLKEPPTRVVCKISEEAVLTLQDQLSRNKSWAFWMSRGAAAAVLLLFVSTSLYFADQRAEPEPSHVEPVTSLEGVEPWIDRSNMIHFAGTSLQVQNSEPLQADLTNSFNKLKLVSSETGFVPSSRKVVLTSTHH